MFASTVPAAPDQMQGFLMLYIFLQPKRHRRHVGIGVGNGAGVMVIDPESPAGARPNSHARAVRLLSMYRAACARVGSAGQSPRPGCGVDVPIGLPSV